MAQSAKKTTDKLAVTSELNQLDLSSIRGGGTGSNSGNIIIILDPSPDTELGDPTVKPI